MTHTTQQRLMSALIWGCIAAMALYDKWANLVYWLGRA